MRYIWLFGLLLLVLPRAAHGQSPVQLYWERYDNIAEIQPDGRVRVQEQQVLVVERGRITFMTRNFVTGSAGNVSEIEVLEDGVAYREGGSAPGSYSGVDNGDEATIRINFLDPSADQHNLTIAYTIENTLLEQGQQAAFDWNFFWSSASAPEIRNGSVELRFPAAVAADQLAVNTAGANVQQTVNGDRARWELTQPIQGQELALQTTFPRTILAANAQFRSADSAVDPVPNAPGAVDPTGSLDPAAGLGFGGVLLCAFTLVLLFIAFSAVRASAGRRRAGGVPPVYGPDPYNPGPFDQGPFGPQPRGRWRRRGRRYGGWGGGWNFPPIVVMPPPYQRPNDQSYDANPFDNDGGGGSSWGDSGGGGSAWGDSGGGSSSWGDAGGGSSSWGDAGGGGGSSWGGGGDSDRGGSGGGGFG